MPGPTAVGNDSANPTPLRPNMSRKFPNLKTTTHVWLLDADPAIRWQVMQDLLNESPEAVKRERGRIEHEGWGARGGPPVRATLQKESIVKLDCEYNGLTEH